MSCHDGQPSRCAATSVDANQCYLDPSLKIPAALQAQYLSVVDDDLFHLLVQVGTRHPSRPMYWRDLSDEQRLKTGCAYIWAERQSAHWPDRDPETKLAAVEALAASELRDLPELAAALAEPWNAAIDTRQILRALGPQAEAHAARLAASWQLSVRALPDLAAELSRPNSAPARRDPKSRGRTKTETAREPDVDG